MQVPNWQKHSKKEQKRHLKPQALRQAKARLRQFKKQHMGRPKGDLSLYDRYIRNETNVHPSRNQISTCQAACH
jgi:type II secretory pathway pseudopilin PulG